MGWKARVDARGGEGFGIAGDGGAASVGGARADLRSALDGLGYGPEEIHAVLVDLPTDGDTGDLLKEALRRLASGV